MRTRTTVLLSRQETADLLSLEECIAAVERAFKWHGEGRARPPGILSVPSGEGAFHIKAGLLEISGKKYFAAKTNGNFFRNSQRFDLPNIVGTIVLCDGENGHPLAIMDSIEITIQRTGAATAVAAKHLSRHPSRVAVICGCGNQGRVQLRAISKVRSIERAFAYDSDKATADRFCTDMSRELGFDVMPTRDLAEAVPQSDICVTCTPSTEYFLKKEYVSPGTFVAAVGADSEHKQELDPALMSSAKIVADVLEQSATIGDLHHAIEGGWVTRASVHAELGEIVAGKKPGRTADDEIIIFDSTGMALQDVAAAAAIYDKAVARGRGTRFDFST
ncbi:MAG: ornithine cyclodeaminase family protein [Acidobacteriia bacterium]|nr:ornithine cyclodeaminase family protein [Terriglobia bacterium]